MNNETTNPVTERGYKSLCTEFYDLTKPLASGEEVTFYTEKLAKKKILEAMCGSGRLLIPLLKAGLEIDGLDNSFEMLEKCKEKLDKENLKATLYEQNIEDLKLPHLYDAIIIAIGSFQLLHPRENALATLIKLREYLNPGGFIILETFIPWEALFEKGEFDESEREVEIDDHTKLQIRSVDRADKFHQFFKSNNTYKKIHNVNTIQREEEVLYVNWYFRYEMMYLLEKAGFQNVYFQEVNFSQNPKGMVYVGEKV